MLEERIDLPFPFLARILETRETDGPAKTHETDLTCTVLPRISIFRLVRSFHENPVFIPVGMEAAIQISTPSIQRVPKVRDQGGPSWGRTGTLYTI